MTQAQDTPHSVEEALQLLRFGCTFEARPDGTVLGEYDVPRFERRALAAADFLEKKITVLREAARKSALERLSEPVTLERTIAGVVVKRVFGKSGLWSGPLEVHEFNHAGPSRSGEATISVVTCHDDESDELKVLIVYAHHEGTHVYDGATWKELTQGVFSGAPAGADAAELEDWAEDRANYAGMNAVIEGITAQVLADRLG